MKKNRESLKAIKQIIPFINDDIEREEKINRIKNLVEKGKYEVDSHKIAEKVISDQLVEKYMLFYPIIIYLAKINK